MEERQRYCAAGTKQHHSVCVADIADIRHGAHDCVFPDTAERNRFTFQLPRPAIPDIMDIIVQV